MAALGHAQLGDEREARRLEEQALGAVEVSGPASREPAMLRLTLLRGDLDAVEQLLAAPGAGKYDVSYAATRLDALVAVGDREGVEREAQPVLALGGYAAPFAASGRYSSRRRPPSTGSASPSLQPKRVRASESQTRVSAG
jgi:hypothetical protein